MALNTDPLVAGAKQYVAEMTDDEFTDFVDEVREPAQDPNNDTKGDATKPSGIDTGRDRYKGGA